MARKLRYAMVGGGPGAFIGAVHRMAAGLDGLAEIVGGAFSSSAEKSAQTGRDRIDFISLVTPNFLHYPVAKAALEAGFDVVCDKPMTMTVEESEDLCRVVKATGRVFALTHNYTGYPAVKQARQMVQEGYLGSIRKIVVEYPQGWLSTLLEATGQKQASWRSDPAKAGISSALGDIGTHCENLVQYISGLEMEEMLADLGTMVEGRALEDDASILIRYKGGARGILYCSQISIGEENNLTIRVYGTKAAIEWKQEHPNWLHVKYPDAPEQIFKRGNGYMGPAAARASRLPSGHPEAFIEAFANVYKNAIRVMQARIQGETPDPLDEDYPTVQDGARGIHFIHTAVKSHECRGWVPASYAPPA